MQATPAIKISVLLGATKYFDKELKPGDKMDLYLISIGAYRNKDDIDCVLLVEEFQKPPVQQARAADLP